MPQDSWAEMLGIVRGASERHRTGIARHCDRQPKGATPCWLPAGALVSKHSSRGEEHGAWKGAITSRSAPIGWVPDRRGAGITRRGLARDGPAGRSPSAWMRLDKCLCFSVEEMVRR